MTTELLGSVGNLPAEAQKKLDGLTSRFQSENKRLDIDVFCAETYERNSFYSRELRTDQKIGAVINTDPTKLDGKPPHALQTHRFIRKYDRPPGQQAGHNYLTLRILVTENKTFIHLTVGNEDFTKSQAASSIQTRRKSNLYEFLKIDKATLKSKVDDSYDHIPTPEENRHKIVCQ